MKQNNLGNKIRTNVSHALWIPFIWMASSAARPISFWISPTRATLAKDEQYMEGSPIDRNILSVLIIVSLYILYKRNIKWRSFFKDNSFLMIWYLYCAFSISWAEFPFISFKRWIKDFGMLLGILIVMTENDPILAIKILFKRFTYLLIAASVLLIVFVPEVGIRGGRSANYAGVSFNKNGLGRICLVSGLFLFYNLNSLYKKNRNNVSSYGDNLSKNKENYLIQYLFIIIIFYLLTILNSATSVGALLVGIIAYLALGFGFMKRNVKYIWVFSVISIVTGITLQYSFDLIGLFITSLDREPTLTGRIYLWKDLLAFGTDPLVGVGYGSFWLGERLTILWDIYYFDVNESHNGYLNVYLELGMVGLCLLGGVLYSAFKKITNSLAYNFEYGRFRMAMLIVVLLYNITEDAFAKLTLMWFVFVLIAIDFPNENRGRNAINPFLPHGRLTTDQRIA